MAMLSARRAVPARVMMSSRRRGTRMTLGPPPSPVLGLLALSTAPVAGREVDAERRQRGRVPERARGGGGGGGGGAGELGRGGEGRRLMRMKGRRGIRQWTCEERRH